MCLQRPDKPVDQLGNEYETLDFVDNDNDTCDYFTVHNDMWTASSNDLTLVQLNVRGITNKQRELLDFINTVAGKEKIDIVLLQETWLTENSIPLVQMPGYKQFHQARTGKRGGRVSVLISNELTCRKLNDLCHCESFLESCTVEIKLPKHNLIVSSVYRPPNTNEHKFNDLIEKLVKTVNRKSSHSLIGLDHNLDLLKSNQHKPTQTFIEVVLENSHIPCITRPTRITKSSATLIDNILVGRDIYNNINCGIALSDLSDHFPCILTWRNIIKQKKNCITFQTKKMQKDSMHKIRSDLDCNWELLNATNNVNQCYDIFNEQLNSVINKYVEEKTVKISYKKIIKEPWLTKGIIESNKKQLCLYNQWLLNKKATDHDRYKQYRDTLRKIKRHHKIDFYNRQCERYKQNSKKLWSTINELCGKSNDKSTSISYITIDGIKQYDSKKISNEFANFFASIGERYATNTPKSNRNVTEYLSKISQNPKSIFLSPCTEYEVKQLINSLENKKSSGHDGISNITLKDLRDVLARPLCIIFNHSLINGSFPDIMKQADVIPLHKCGNIHIIDNYRPISLLTTISKILEKIVYKRVYTFLDTTNQIYVSQYGFRSKHSCEQAVSELVGNILKGKEKNEHTLAVFLDLSKAFDTLEYDTLFKKLDLYGIRGTALNWFKSYLTDRTMRTKCNINSKSILSENKPVTYGAPQGSCLGPLLFLIFCNDLHLNLEYTKCILFADDTTIFYSDRNVSLLIAAVEHDLMILNDWFKANKLTLNKKKSVCILFKSIQRINFDLPSGLKIDNEEIRFVDHTKFLGVWIDCNLNWNIHTNRVIMKIRKNAHLLYRSKRYLSVHAKKILYYVQIYSHISYGISVWGPMTNTASLRKIGQTQKKCLQSVSAQRNSQFLTIDDIIRLEILKFGWKLVNHTLPSSLHACALSSSQGLTLEKTHRYSTRNKRIPNVPRVTNKLYKSSIFCKGIVKFSELRSELKEAKSYNYFVKLVKKEILTN